jgi:hypothetical protein
VSETEKGLSRRDLLKTAALAGAAAMLPVSADAQTLESLTPSEALSSTPSARLIPR